MDFTIREAAPFDAAGVAALSGELGYVVTDAVMEDRLRHVERDPGHAVLVACASDGGLIGWIDVGMTFHIQSGSYAEIGGLVVTASARRNGVGRELVLRAEIWAASHGARRMVVRSNAVREDAHRFYLRESYQRIKTSAVFEKLLA